MDLDQMHQMHWNQYVQSIKLCQYYVDKLLQTNVAYYATTGAVWGIFWNAKDKKEVRNLLLLPIFMGFMLVVLMGFLWTPLCEFYEKIADLEKLLELKHPFNPVVLTYVVVTSVIGWTLMAGFQFLRWKQTKMKRGDVFKFVDLL